MSETETPETIETVEQKKARRKQKQHEAWARWYASDKGKAYRLKMNERRRIAAALPDVKEPQS